METSKSPEAMYEKDFALWLNGQLDALRNHDFEGLDIANLVDELRGRAGRKRIELSSCMRMLIAHLLKCAIRPRRKRSSWLATLTAQRFHIEQLLRQSPSLKALLEQCAMEKYDAAVRKAAIETGMPRRAFPDKLPYTIDQLLDPDFIP